MRPATATPRPTLPGLRRPRLNRLTLDGRRLSSLTAWTTLVVVLALLALSGLRTLATPDVVPASAPPTAFSAERAMDHLQVIAAESRGAGLPGHAAARDYLLAQVEAMGLEAEIQETTVVVTAEEGTDAFGAARVQNVVARLPGTDSTGAIVINAHYDSGPTGPAAADAGSGVVTTLETLRAVLAGEPLRNDLIVVFADAEEIGMLGAAAFVEQHPWADDVRLAINFEAQGSGGPALLYATHEGNGWLVGEYLDIAPNPTAWSLLPEISRLVPTARLDCDLGEYTGAGALGIGFVFASDTSAYHTVRDNVDVIDPGTIQQEGDNTLATVRHFGNLDLRDAPQSGDRVFFNVAPGVVAHYPAWAATALAAVFTALLACLVVLGLRRRTLTKGGLAVGALALVIGAPLVLAAVALAWAAARTLNADYQVMLIGSYQSTLYDVALSLLAVGLLAALYTLLARRVQRVDLAAGALLGWLPVLWLLSLAAPGMSYLATWPALFGLAPLGWALLAPERATSPLARALMLGVAAVPAIVLLPGAQHQVAALLNRFEGISGAPIFGLIALFVVLWAALLAPHAVASGQAAGRARRWAPPLVATALAVALIGWGNLTSGYDAEHPRPNRVAYTLDADSGQAAWVVPDQNLDAWTTQFIPAGTPRGEYDSQLMDAIPAYIAPAPVAAIDPPEVALLSDTVTDGVRSLTLNLRSPQAAAVMAVDIAARGEVVALSIDGHDVDLADLGWARDGEFPVVYHNTADNGWTLALSVRSTEPVTLTVETTANGLPDIPGVTVVPRPADMMPAPWHALDPTIVKATFER